MAGVRRWINDHRELEVYCLARDTAMSLYEITCTFPREEQYSLTAQVRRSSRSVCANIAEAWQKRRYPAAFTAKLVDAAAEADETRCWIDFAVRCGFFKAHEAAPLEEACDKAVGMLVRMANRPQSWATHANTRAPARPLTRSPGEAR